MAENPGENTQISGRIAGQSFSFATGNPVVLIMVLLIVCGLVGGFIAWFYLDRRIEDTSKGVMSHLDLLQTHHVRFFDMIERTRDENREELARVLKNLIILQHNITHPDQEMPLGMNGPPATLKPPP